MLGDEHSRTVPVPQSVTQGRVRVLSSLRNFPSLSMEDCSIINYHGSRMSLLIIRTNQQL